MNQIIDQLVRTGISVVVSFNKEEDRIEYIVDGFYKSGTIKLIDEGDGNDENFLTAIARYDERTTISSVRDLVKLNYDWWQSSRDRFDGWKDPNIMWIPLLLDYSFIQTITTYR